MAAQPIRYQGRKATRSSSRQRRDDILEAALRIIVRHGIRGVRHRAVAREAGVPLAATTYYFKDLDGLINDAFSLFAEREMKQTAELRAICFSAVEAATGGDSVELAEQLAVAVADHIFRQAIDRDGRILEQAFREEALRNAALHDAMASSMLQTIEPIIQFCENLDSIEPTADARIILGTILQLEYEYAMCTPPPRDATQIRATVRHLMRSLFGV